MKKFFNLKTCFIGAFVLVEFVLYMILLFGDWQYMRFLSYGITVLCLTIAIIFISKKEQKLFQIGAFVCTLVADFFLVIKQGEHKTLAMWFFLGAQIFYACRTYYLAYYPKERLIQLFSRIIISVLVIIIACIILKSKVEFLFIISVVYYFNMLMSILFAFMHFKEDLSVKLLAIGLMLFACCDISIGFDFMIDIFALTKGNFIYDIMHSGVHFVNLFYPPSQVLLAISSGMVKTNKKI